MPFGKICQNCGLEFESVRRRSRFHSIACANSFRARETYEKKSIYTKGLTPKQAALVLGVVARKSATQAALDAGYDVGDPNDRNNRKKANWIARRELAKPHVKEVLREILEAHGVTVDYLVNHLKNGLEATRKIATHTNGSKMASLDVPDWTSRAKYFQDAIRLLGLDTPESTEGEEEDYVDRIMRLRNNFEEREKEIAGDIHYVEIEEI